MINEHDIKDWHHVEVEVLDTSVLNDGRGKLVLSFTMTPDMFDLTTIEMLALVVAAESK